MRKSSSMTLCAFAVVASVGVYRATDVQSQGPLFAPGSRIPVGPGSGQVVLVDVNQDGHLDMVTRHLVQRSVAVFIGDGKGGFTPGTAMTLGYQPGDIAVADVNGDTAADLVVANSERDEVDVFLGDRKGGFNRAPGSPFTASASREFYTRGVHLIDVNDDGRLDIVTTNGRDNTFGILFGDGRGKFSRGPTIRRDSNAQQRHAFAFGDVNGDGHIDAVVASREDDAVPPEPGRIAVLLGNGTGGFKEAGGALVVAPNPHFVTLADTNGDRRPDLVISHSASRLVSVLLNDGTGKFAQAPGSPIDIGTEAFTVVAADGDGDGKPDLFAATVGSATVLLGDGRGRFLPAPGSPFRAGPGAYKITAGDINEDGKLDVATSSFEGNAVTVLLRR